MTPLASIWGGAIPVAPLFLAHAALLWAAVALLAVCAVALWCERERRFSAPLPKPFHSGDHERLAA